MQRYFARLKKPEWAFALIAFIFGSLMILLIPNQAGFDENDHLARIWEISGGYLIPNQRFSKGPYLPAAFVNMSYRNQFFINIVDPNFFVIHANDRIDWNEFDNYKTRDSYTPIQYFPQAIIVGLLCRVANKPVLMVFYILRVSYLLGYIILTYFSIKLIPIGKWLLAALALAPMALFQSSTINTDAYTNGVCFLFLAWVLRLSLQNQPMRWKQLWISIGIIALLFSVKLDGAFLLPLLLLLDWKKFESKKMLPILIGMVALLFAIMVIGWNLLSYASFYRNTTGYGIVGQLDFILNNPLKFITIFGQNLIERGPIYLRDWVAAYGYGNATVPPFTYPLFIIALIAAWFLSPSGKPLKAGVRILLITSGIVGSILTIMIFYLTLDSIGSTSFAHVLGRHFIPMLPPLFIGLVPNPKMIFDKVAKLAAPIFSLGIVSSLIFYALGIYLSFYVVCGASLYTPGLCYQPRYKNWDPNAHTTQVVTDGVSLEQPFTAVCTPIHSVRVWSLHASQYPSGQTQITLKDAATGEELYKQLVNNQDTANKNWLEATFPPINNTKGKQFLLEITSELSDPANGLSFGVSERREYLDGIMVNNVPEPYDLLFQYGCEP